MGKWTSLIPLVGCVGALAGACYSWRTYLGFSASAIGQPVESQLVAYQGAMSNLLSGSEYLAFAFMFGMFFLAPRILLLERELADLRARLLRGE